MKSFLEFISSDNATQAIAKIITSIPPDIILLIVVVLIAYFGLFRGIPKLMRLWGFSKKLSLATQSVNQKGTVNWQELANALPELNELLSEFRELLTNTATSTQNFELIISEDNVFRALDIDEAALEHFPGIFTGLGVAGTFMGILYVLAPVADNIDKKQGEKGLVDNLMQGAGVAFLTSVVGIASSLAFLAFERKVVGRFKKELYNFKMAINGHLQKVTTESLLVDIKDATETMADDIASAVTNTITKTLGALEETISRSLERAGEGSQEIVGKVLERIEGSLDKFSDNIQLLEASSVVQTDILKQFDVTVNNAIELTSKFEKLLPMLNQSLASMEVSSQRLEKLPEALEEMVTAQKEFGTIVRENLDKLTENWESERERLTSLAEELSQRYGEFEEGISRGLQSTMSKFDDELSRAGTYVVTWLDRLHEDVQQFESTLGSFNGNIEERSAEIDRRLAEFGKILVDHADSYRDSSSTITDGLIDEFAKLKNSLNEVPKEIDNSLAKLQEIYREATETLPGMLADSMEKLVGEVETKTRGSFASRFFRR